MKSKSKLDKLKMPMDKKLDMSDMDLDMAPEGSDEEEASESPDEEKQEDMSDEKEGKAIDLTNIPDDELLAEIKKRGLMDQLSQHGDEANSAPSDDQEQYS